MGQTAVIPAQIVDVAARSLLGNNTASTAPANAVSAVSYRQRQIDESIAAISAERRRLKDLLRTP